MSFGGDISFPPSLRHQIYVNLFVCGLPRKACFVALQQSYFQDAWIKTGGLGSHQALGLPGIHLPCLLSFYDGGYTLWGATRLDRKPLFKDFCQYCFQEDWMGVWTSGLGQVFCSSSFLNFLFQSPPSPRKAMQILSSYSIYLSPLWVNFGQFWPQGVRNRIQQSTVRWPKLPKNCLKLTEID